MNQYLKKISLAAGERAERFKKKFEAKQELKGKILNKWKDTAKKGLDEAIAFMVEKELDRIEQGLEPKAKRASLNFPEKDILDYLQNVMINDLNNIKIDYEHMFLEGETYGLKMTDFYSGFRFPDYIVKKVIEILHKDKFTVLVGGRKVSDLAGSLPMDALWKIAIEW